MAATKFTVVLDVPLTAQQRTAINKDLQAIAKKHLAGIDNKGIFGSRHIPIEWLGIWLRKFKDLDSLKASKNFSKANLR